MGKGRAPCCDKSQVKRGPWSPAEDLRLITFIQKHGHDNWRALPKLAGLARCGKSCRLRWINYLRPDVKRGNFTNEEEEAIINLHQTLGNKWSKIASYFPGRTDNEIKNVWNTHLKKRVAPKSQDSAGADESNDSSATYSSSSSSTTTKRKKRRPTETNTDDDNHHHNRRPRHLDTGDSTVPKKPRVSCEDTKPMFPTNSSSSSNISNITNSSPVDTVSLPGSAAPSGDEFEAFLFDDFLAPPNFDHIRNILELEVNKPEIQEITAASAITAADQAVEIPFEADTDFWNMLDGLNPFEECNNSTNGGRENSSDQSSNLGEIDNKKWLRYIENELGLETTAINGGEDDSAKGSGNEMKPPEVNPDIGYYHTWPSL